MDTLTLSIVRITQPVKIEDENGVITEYELREMTGTLRDQYLNGQRRIMETTKAGTHVVKDFNGSQSALLSRCLYEVASGKAVPEAKIQEWPITVQGALHSAAQKINRLDRIGSTPAMNHIYTILAQPDMSDEDKMEAIRQTVDAWRKGDEETSKGES